MKLHNSLCSRLLTDKERIAVQSALTKDKVLIRFLIKVLDERLEQANHESKESDFDVANWACLRAFKDGKAAELRWLKNFIEEKED